MYDGQWCDGLRHGVGTMVYPTMDPKTKRSDSYSGQWVKGLREGRGAYRYVNGDIYSGSWKAGKKETREQYLARPRLSRGRCTDSSHLACRSAPD